MPVTISWQTLVSFAAVLGAGAVVWNYITRVVHKLEYDREQDERIARLEEAHARDIADLRRHHDEDMAATRKEMAIICRGILASLKDDDKATVLYQGDGGLFKYFCTPHCQSKWQTENELRS